jgi:hypothetical protein
MFIRERKAPSGRNGNRGSAILIVMALLGIMVLLFAVNSRTLHHLQQELKWIDERQQIKYR